MLGTRRPTYRRAELGFPFVLCSSSVSWGERKAKPESCVPAGESQTSARADPSKENSRGGRGTTWKLLCSKSFFSSLIFY